MRALVFETRALDTATCGVVEIPAPEPAPGQVTVDVCHAGIDFKDVWARRGDLGYVREWPFVPGLEVAGTVCALGRGASGLQVGQPVAAFTGAGGSAEVAAADRPLVQPVPEEVTLDRRPRRPAPSLPPPLLVPRMTRSDGRR